VALARTVIGERRFYLTFGDNLTPWDIGRLTAAHERNGAAATLALFRARDPRRHGVAELEGERIVGIVEKPQQPRSEWAVAGMYLLEPIIFEAVAQLQPREKGEYWLPDAIEWLIEGGHVVAAAKLGTWRTNVNTPQEFLEANRLLLADGAAPTTRPMACSVTEPVCVGAGTQAHQTAHLGPAVSCGERCRIGEGARVENSVLLDRVSIGAGATVRDCLIGEGAVIGRGATMEGRIIGDRGGA